MVCQVSSVALKVLTATARCWEQEQEATRGTACAIQAATGSHHQKEIGEFLLPFSCLVALRLVQALRGGNPVLYMVKTKTRANEKNYKRIIYVKTTAAATKVLKP